MPARSRSFDSAKIAEVSDEMCVARLLGVHWLARGRRSRCEASCALFPNGAVAGGAPATTIRSEGKLRPRVPDQGLGAALIKVVTRASETSTSFSSRICTCSSHSRRSLLLGTSQ